MSSVVLGLEFRGRRSLFCLKKPKCGDSFEENRWSRGMYSSAHVEGQVSNGVMRGKWKRANTQPGDQNEYKCD